MASPQTENGYTKIANELLEQLVKTAILGSEYQIVFFIIRKTYGFNKKEDRISLTQFQKNTNLSRATIVKGLKNLVLMNLLVKTAIPTYKLNKDWETWVVKTAKLVKHNDIASIDRLTNIGIDGYTHKRNKEIIQNKLAAKPLDEVNLIINLFQTINPGINYANLTNRKAAEWLISKYGFEKASSTAEYAVMSTGKPYAPTITTPYQLKEKLGSLIAFYKKDTAEGLTKQSKHLKL